jgi:hypothetical protein
MPLQTGNANSTVSYALPTSAPFSTPLALESSASSATSSASFEASAATSITNFNFNVTPTPTGHSTPITGSYMSNPSSTLASTVSGIVLTSTKTIVASSVDIETSHSAKVSTFSATTISITSRSDPMRVATVTVNATTTQKAVSTSQLLTTTTAVQSAPLPQPVVLFILPGSAFAGETVLVTAAIANLLPWLTNSISGGLGVTAAMYDGSFAPNVSISKTTTVVLNNNQAVTVTILLSAPPGTSGLSNVTLFLGGLTASVSMHDAPRTALASFNFDWLPADRPSVSNFNPKTEYVWGNTPLRVDLANAPVSLSCANLSCRVGSSPLAPLATCVTVIYTGNGAGSMSRSATAVFTLPVAATGSGSIQPVMYINTAENSGQAALSLKFPANFTYRDPPAPSISRVTPSSSAMGVGAVISLTVINFPQVLTADDISVTFQWNTDLDDNANARATITSLTWLDGTAASSVQSLSFVVSTPATARSGSATIVVSSSRFQAAPDARALFLFIDTSQPQVVPTSASK